MSADWLAQLAPAHAPPPASWWPLAPGWWALGLLVLAGLAAYLYWRTRPQQKLTRASLCLLAEIERGGFADGELAARLQDLLRRHAVARYGRETVARLAGPAWLAFLGEHGAPTLAGEAGAAFLQAAYADSVAPAASPAFSPRQPPNAGEAAGATWLAAARSFVRHRSKRANAYTLGRAIPSPPAPPGSKAPRPPGEGLGRGNVVSMPASPLKKP